MFVRRLVGVVFIRRLVQCLLEILSYFGVRWFRLTYSLQLITKRMKTWMSMLKIQKHKYFSYAISAIAKPIIR